MPSHPVPSQFQSEAAKIWRMKHTVAAGLVAVSLGMAAEVRLTNDSGGGYVSVYTMATGIPYTDAVLQECSVARGRQNEPTVVVDPRNSNVLVGSSNDYCGT